MNEQDPKPKVATPSLTNAVAAAMAGVAVMTGSPASIPPNAFAQGPKQGTSERLTGRQAVEAAYIDFAKAYEGVPQVSLLVGAPPGSGLDILGRFFQRYLGQLGSTIPGAPSVVPQNAPGAGSALALQRLTSGPRDGTQLVIPFSGPFTFDFVDLEPRAKVPGLKDLEPVGGFRDKLLCVARKTDPPLTVEQMRTTEVISPTSAPGADGDVTSRNLSAALGVKIRVVTGYGSIGAMTLALQNGEAGIICGIAESVLRQNYPGLFDMEKGFTDQGLGIILQAGTNSVPELQGVVPLASDYAVNDEQRRMIEFFDAQQTWARGLFVAPPAESATPEAKALFDTRLSALRNLFTAAAQDPAFAEEAKKFGVQPILSGEIKSNIGAWGINPTPEISGTLKSIKGALERR